MIFQCCDACLGAGAVPEWNALQVLLLQDVHQVPLVHIDESHNRGLIRKGDNLDHLLEASISERKQKKLNTWAFGSGHSLTNIDLKSWV